MSKKSKQNWLIKKIPNDYKDKDTLLEILILECIKDFVEGEKCFEMLASSPNPDHPDVIDCSSQYQFMAEVKENYRLITEELPKLEKELEKEWKKIPPVDINKWIKEVNTGTKQSYKKTYGQIDKLEKQIYDIQTKIMVWAVKKRNQMWT